jgi:hypothetical protein
MAHKIELTEAQFLAVRGAVRWKIQEDNIAGLSTRALENALKVLERPARPVTRSGSVQCPHCRWGFAPSVIEQHIREKHGE